MANDAAQGPNGRPWGPDRVEMVPTDALTPYAQNPRENDPAVDAVAQSIREYGFRQPIVVDAENVIIAGHTRWKAAKKLGLEKVPVHVTADLTPEQVRAYRIADNKLHELSRWDKDLLSVELGALRALDVDLEALGFTGDELTQLFGETLAEGLTDPDAAPEPPDEPVTQPGDLWVLGDHRLLRGDAGKTEDVDRLRRPPGPRDPHPRPNPVRRRTGQRQRRIRRP